MKSSTLATLLSAHAKGLAVAGIAVAATAGGGVAAITTVANTHAAPGLATAKAAQSANHDATDTDQVKPTTSESPDAHESESPDATDDQGKTKVTPTSTASCPAGFTGNHGAYVSGVAHSVSPGPGHGAAVSAAAQSDCGKPSPEPTQTQSSSAAAAPTHSAKTHANTHATTKSNNRNNTHRSTKSHH